MCGAAKTLSIAARTRAGRGSGRIGRWRKRATTRSRASCLSTCRLLTRIKCAAAAAAAHSAAIDASPATYIGWLVACAALLPWRGQTALGHARPRRQVHSARASVHDQGGQDPRDGATAPCLACMCSPRRPPFPTGQDPPDGARVDDGVASDGGLQRRRAQGVQHGGLPHPGCAAAPHLQRAPTLLRWGHRRCSPMRRATWPRAAPQPRMPTGCSARRPLTALGSASSAAACCWAGRSPRRPTGPALTTALCLLGGGLLLGRPLATAPYRTGAHHGARRVEQTSARPGG